VDHSMLHALCSQRDRFKGKALELQEDLAVAAAKLSSAESAAAAARADNVALVERLRYVQSVMCAPLQLPRAVTTEQTGKLQL
jgi:homeobox protein cut-like